MTDSNRRHGDAEGGLSRWSRLKRTGTADREDVSAAGPASAPQPPAVDDGPRPPPTLAGADPAPEPATPPDLPSLEGLDAASDYRVFLQAHVPEELRRQALRLLWRSDPVLANLDGLNDYDEDYRRIGMVAEAVRTAYRVGKGYLSDTEAGECLDPDKVEPSAEAERETAICDPEATAEDQAVGVSGPSDETGRHA